MISTKSTNVASLLDQMHELVDRIGNAAQAPAFGPRNAELIAGYANTAELVSWLRFEPVSYFDYDGMVGFGWPDPDRERTPMSLIELFYVLDEPSVRKHLYADGYGIVVVEGLFKGQRIRSQMKFDQPDVVELLRNSTPSVHLLRRLQVEGAR